MMAIKDGDKHLPFGYLFDVNYFSQALKTSCPRRSSHGYLSDLGDIIPRLKLSTVNHDEA